MVVPSRFFLSPMQRRRGDGGKSTGEMGCAWLPVCHTHRPILGVIGYCGCASSFKQSFTSTDLLKEQHDHEQDCSGTSHISLPSLSAELARMMSRIIRCRSWELPSPLMQSVDHHTDISYSQMISTTVLKNLPHLTTKPQSTPALLFPPMEFKAQFDASL
ncbi:hypothetical protein B296_00001643 [Ensete ventricosum]|uniref:Uncharacterized protein n=1 Tax=Ensete ventricosum TaxID=4639 RepID=A0A426ZYW0_ENSVE|nr:hypothetical protein B296_00001643 [Ensete ventricosum]